MRLTKVILHTRMKDLNRRLRRPEMMFLDEPDSDGGRMAVGHLYMDKNQNGYQVEELVSSRGAAHNWTGRMTAKEAMRWMDGFSSGISLAAKK